MKATTLFVTGFLAGSVCAQNANAVLNSISLIQNSTMMLNSDVQQYNDTVEGLPWALQVQLDSINIYRQVNTGKAAADASAPFDQNGSTQVSSALLNVSSIVKTALSNTAKKATTFGDLGPLVRVSLYQLKRSTDLFANSTIAKLQPAQAAVAPSVKSDLDKAFNDAIAAYGGKPASG